ncbi:hypothetical protein N8580_03680 [Akkermansiaceae bacterium]|nr:hypothetical protein [Akkermansiaceae bacterium]MDB4142943.1 hypothetical protein [Akkermansiaceae bacterium]MDB4681947.1 hypothetical protein [Akkermansiaceae bacterium]
MIEGEYLCMFLAVMNDFELPQSAKWLRDKQAVAIYSLSRTKLWMLAKAGKIRSVSLQEPGMSRATRLFDAKSIDDYIESFLPEKQKTQPQAE